MIPLAVTDSLLDREVIIVVTLPAGNQPRKERSALISLGVAGQSPVLRTGMMGDMPALVNEAWTAFGVQAQLAAVAAQTAEQDTGTAPTQVVAEEPLAATDNADDASIPALAPRPTVAKPPANNLSLF